MKRDEMNRSRASRGPAHSTVRINSPREICAAFIAAGAVSPADAKALTAFPLIDEKALDVLVRQGVIREGAPGTFYVYQPNPGSTPGRRFIMTMLFWLIILIIPILLIQFLP